MFIKLKMGFEEEARVTFMPPVGETETLYSISARLHSLGSRDSSVATSTWLYGFHWAANLHDIPGSLNNFGNVTRSLLGTPEDMLLKRTVAGLYLRFMDRSRAQSIVQACTGKPGGRSKFRLGLQSSRLPATHPLRFCEQCLREDQNILGFGTWRVEHQLPGAIVCTHHARPLSEPFPSESHSSKEWLRPDRFEKLQPSRVLDEPQQSFWKDVATMLFVLLKMERVDRSLIQWHLKQALAAQGVIRTVNALNNDRLVAWAVSKGQDKAIECAPEYASLKPGDWMRDLLLGRRAAHPLRWAVLCSMVMGAKEFTKVMESSIGLQSTLFGGWEDPNSPRRDLLVSTGGEGELSSDRRRNRALRMNPEIHSELKRERHESRLHACTTRILDFLRMNVAATRTMVITACMKDVRWLERNSPQWLTVNLPAKAWAWRDKEVISLFSDQKETH